MATRKHNVLAATCLVVLITALSHTPAVGRDGIPPTGGEENVFPQGTFENFKQEGWWGDWGAGVEIAEENGNHFLRLTSKDSAAECSLRFPPAAQAGLGSPHCQGAAARERHQAGRAGLAERNTRLRA